MLYSHFIYVHYAQKCFIYRIMIADDLQRQNDGYLYQNQLDDPEVRAEYDKYWNSVVDSSNESLPDL